MAVWQEKRLGEVAEIISGGTPDTNNIEFWGGNIGWITPFDLSNYNYRYICNGTRNITDRGLTNSSAKLLPSNTILFSSRAPIGYIAIAKKTLTTNQGFKNFICKDINYLFLYYYLKHNVSYLKLYATGATFPELSATTIKKIKISVPDLATQEKVADILSTYDDLIENNNRRIEILEQMAQEIYKEWFVRFRFPGHEKVKFVNGIPEGWEVKKVKDIVDRKPFGTLYKESQVQEDGNVIVIDQSKKDYIGFHNNKPSHNADIDKPMILFGDHSCKYKIMITPFSLAENVIPFTSNDENLLTTYYLFYSIIGIIQTTEYKRHWTDLTNKKIIISNINLQTKFEEKIKEFLLEIEQLSIINQNLIKQRDLLLPRLMSGKLEV